jgi:DNA-binding MarR family transcriptional regulator
MKVPDELLACRDCNCSRVRSASRAVTQLYEDHFRGSGIRATQFTVLSTLVLTGPIPVSKLAEFLGLDRTTLTRNLSPLLRQKLVSVSDDGDGRVRVITATKKGEAMARTTLPLWKQAEAEVGAVLSKFGVSLG